MVEPECTEPQKTKRCIFPDVNHTLKIVNQTLTHLNLIIFQIEIERGWSSGKNSLVHSLEFYVPSPFNTVYKVSVHAEEFASN